MKSIMESKLCECNCGEFASPGSRFISGHNRGRLGKGRPQPESKLCDCHCGGYAKPGYKYIKGHNRRIKPISIPNHHLCECGKCEILVASDKRFVRGHQIRIKHPMADPLVRESATLNLAITNKKPEVKKKRSESAIKRFERPGEKEKVVKNLFDPDVRKRALELATIAQNKPEARVKQKERLIRFYQDPVNNKRKSDEQKEIHNRPEIKENQSIKQKANWQDPEYRESQLLAIAKGLNLKPNRPETLIDIITYEYWTGWKYTGDYFVVINGKNPDFVNEEQKLIIEVYGDYWHRGEDPTDRAEIFAQAGYETCVIWEHELNNLDEVILKLRRFMNGGINAWA